MNTLELTIQRKTDSGYPVIAALTRSDGSLPLRREGTLHLDLAALAEFQFEPLASGTVLGKALFVDEIRDTFVKAFGDDPLRVLLSVEAPNLRALAWHRLAAPFDGRWRFLAAQQNTPFSLAIPSPASAHFPAIGRRDLRALVLVAGPESLSGDYKLAPFDVAATTASIQAALGDIPCDILPNPSLDALCAALTATPYTLLHIVCHGAVNHDGETILYFPKDEKRSPTHASDLLDRLASLARLPHFVFLSACESALPQNGLGSLAGRLVRELGLPAVLAMTDRVSIATAGAIAAPFYAHLYQHGQPDLALAQSLAGLQGAHDLTVPAIFSRLGDRPLFDDNPERALTEIELEFGLAKLVESLPERAPVMDSLREKLTLSLRSTPGADAKSLSETRRTERKETLDQLNSLSLETLDLSFNALCLGQTPPAYDSRSPFRGLESFRPEDKDYFFGRETLTRKLVQKLNEHNFLAVLGASGSGKSSLVMAGLIPALKVPYAVFRPGAEPLSELDKALQTSPQLLVVDQFEELFTLSAREQRVEFISRLLEQSQKIQVVITLRADFLGEVAPFKSLKDEVQNHQEIIPPMDEAELRRAMEGQAGCAGLRFESDLSQQMLDDVAGEPGAMPLLQHALWTLWMRRHGRWLRAEEYRAFGGVKQAIASTAEAVYTRCTEFEKERLRDIFLRLTRLDEGTDGRDTRRRVLLRDLIPADSDPTATTLLIKQLADARLVVVTGGEVEVAHEALIRHWERLCSWLNDDRDNLRLREGVSDAANAWRENPKNTDLLIHRGGRLEDALKLRSTLNVQEQIYLDACKTAVQKRRQVTIASISFAMLIIMAVLVGWGWSSNENSRQLGYQVATAAAAKANSEQRAKVSRAGELVSLARYQNKNKNNLDLSLLLSVEASKSWDFYQTRGILLDLLCTKTRVIQSDSYNQPVVAFSPDGLKFATSGPASSITIWKAKSKEQIGPHLYGEAYGVESLSFSPNGKTLASGSEDGTIILFDLKTYRSIGKLKTGNRSRILSINFSPNGKFLVSTSCNNSDCNYGYVILWDVSNQQIVGQIVTDNVANVAIFSPDGNTIASTDNKKSIVLWDISTKQPIGSPLLGHTDRVTSLAFSLDGKILASGSYDRQVILWDLTSRSQIGVPFEGNTDKVYSVTFSSDGKTVASASVDNKVILWDVESHKIKGVSFGEYPDSELKAVTFSADMNNLLSVYYDGTVALSDTLACQSIEQDIQVHNDSAIIGFDTNDILVSADRNGIVNSWAVKLNTTLSRKTINHSKDEYVGFNFNLLNGIIASNTGKNITLWDIHLLKPIDNIEKISGIETNHPPTPLGNGISFSDSAAEYDTWTLSPDGKLLAVGNHNITTIFNGGPIAEGGNEITVWNIATHQPIAHLTTNIPTIINKIIFEKNNNILVAGYDVRGQIK